MVGDADVILPVALHGHDYSVVHADERLEEVPYMPARMGYVDVAPPEPGLLSWIMPDHGQGLGVVNYNEVMLLEMIHDGVLLYLTEVYLLLLLGEREILSLEPVMELLGYVEECVPSVRTIERVLHRCGLVKKRRKRAWSTC